MSPRWGFGKEEGLIFYYYYQHDAPPGAKNNITKQPYKTWFFDPGSATR